MPRGAAPAALAGRLRLPLLRPSRALRAGGARALSMQPVQEADSPTAGTIFHATKLPLTLWFAAIHLIVTAKNGISSVELGRRLGVKQPTAWDREAQDHGGDGAARGGDAAYGAGRDGRRLSRRGALRRQAGPRRGGQTPFVAAVSTSPEGRPRKLKLVPVFRKREIARGEHWLAPGAAVVTDGLGCYSTSRLQPSGNPHRVGPTGGLHGAIQMGEHDARQVRDHRDHRKLGPDHAGRTSPFRLALQPALSTRNQVSSIAPEPMPYRLLIAG